jgi:hypothetical protein
VANTENEWAWLCCSEILFAKPDWSDLVQELWFADTAYSHESYKAEMREVEGITQAVLIITLLTHTSFVFLCGDALHVFTADFTEGITLHIAL